MKTLVKNYTFNASQKTITFTDDITLDSILLITNVTQNKIIYNFASIGGTLSNKVLNLNYDTTTMSNSDVLQIFINDQNTIDVTMQNNTNANGNGNVLNIINQSFAVLDVQGTFNATVNFEATVDGTNYFALPVIRISTSALTTTTTTAGQFAFRCAGYKSVRARISSYVSGSITVYSRASLNGNGHHSVSIANSPVVTLGGIDQTTATKSFTLQSGATALGNGTVIDVTGYSTLSLDVVISGTATVIFEVSNDNVNFTNITYVTLISTNSVSGSSMATTSRANRFNVASIRYFRARISAYTSGTVDVTGIASNSPLNQLLSTVNFSGDAVGAGVALSAGVYNYLYDTNATVWVRQRSNFHTTILSSSTRTSTTNGSDITNYSLRGIIIFLNVTAAAGTGGLQIALQIKDLITTNYKTLNTLATAITSTGQYVVQLYPGIDTTNSANTQNISQILPQTFRVQIIHGDSSSYTYSVIGQLII